MRRRCIARSLWHIPFMLLMRHLLVFAALFPLGAPCSIGAECNSNSDCDGDEGVCVDGACVECEDDSDCEGAQTCENNECQGAAEGEGEGEGDPSDVPEEVEVIASLCASLAGCGIHSNEQECNAQGQTLFEGIPNDPACDELRAALVAAYRCAAAQDCRFFESGPVEGGPCFAEFNAVSNLGAELGERCSPPSADGEGEGEGEPPRSCREALGIGDDCDCGCVEADPDCGDAGCTEPGCVAPECQVCWVDEITPTQCG